MPTSKPLSESSVKASLLFFSVNSIHLCSESSVHTPVLVHVDDVEP